MTTFTIKGHAIPDDWFTRNLRGFEPYCTTRPSLSSRFFCPIPQCGAGFKDELKVHWVKTHIIGGTALRKGVRPGGPLDAPSDKDFREWYFQVGRHMPDPGFPKPTAEEDALFVELRNLTLKSQEEDKVGGGARGETTTSDFVADCSSCS